MPTIKYSVMILPKKSDHMILLQKITDPSKNRTYWDGFGTFYESGESSIEAVKKVFNNISKNEISPEQFEFAAKLTFIIKKPRETVELHTKIYFVNMDDMQKDSLSSNSVTQWYEIENIPYEDMHEATRYWLPLLVKDGYVKAIITINQPDGHLEGSVEEFKRI